MGNERTRFPSHMFIPERSDGDWRLVTARDWFPDPAALLSAARNSPLSIAWEGSNSPREGETQREKVFCRGRAVSLLGRHVLLAIHWKREIQRKLKVVFSRDLLQAVLRTMQLNYSNVDKISRCISFNESEMTQDWVQKMDYSGDIANKWIQPRSKSVLNCFFNK